MSSRNRARVFAGFLAAHVVFAVPWALVADWGWLIQLSPDTEGGAANVYSGILWGAVSALGAAQLLRPRMVVRGPRWLWVVGWLSVATLAAFVAVEEFAELKGTAAVHAALHWLNLGLHLSWLVLFVSCAAPLAAAAGWVFYTSLRRRPRLALLTALAGIFAASAVLRDTFDQTHDTFDAFLRQVAKPSPVVGPFLEEGAELMAAAILAVVLVEMVAARQESPRDVPGVRAGGSGRWIAFAVGAALLAAGAFALAMEYQQEDERWVRDPARLYAGPVSLIEQQFRVNRDHLTRVEVWAFVDGDVDSTAEIFARLTPVGSADGPIRESRAEVQHERWSHKTVDFHFEPIPDSGGTLYTLAVGVLSGPTPHVFLGLTGGDVNPEGAAVVNGAPTRYADDLAMRTYWVGRSNRALEAVLRSHPQLLFSVGDLLVHVFLWVFAIVAAWDGLSDHPPHVWRGFMRGAVRRSVLVTASIAAVVIALFPVMVATPHAIMP